MKTFTLTMSIAFFATTCQAQHPVFPSYPVMPVFPTQPFNGNVVIHPSAFDAGRDWVMPGTAPLVTPNGVHWLGVDGKPHGQFQDRQGNMHVYANNPNAAKSPTNEMNRAFHPIAPPQAVPQVPVHSQFPTQLPSSQLPSFGMSFPAGF